MTRPAIQYMQEANVGKLGQGEFGDKVETQAVYSQFSLTCSRLSEIAYFMSFFLGKEDSLYTVDGSRGIVSHRLEHFGINARTLPTFSAQYSDGVRVYPMNHCIISDFSLSASEGGTGVVECTFNGFCNMHSVSSGIFSEATVTNAWVSGKHDATVEAEPLVNFRGMQLYLGSALEATPLVHANITYAKGSTDLSSGQNLTALVSTFTITGNNGISAETLMRACGDGILNNQERGDFAFTLELGIRKSDSQPTTQWDALALADTQRAIEILWAGKNIASGNRYAMKWFFPVVQIGNVAEDDGSPIVMTVPTSVMQGTDGLAFSSYVQNKLALRYNASHSASGEASSSSTSANEVSSSGSSTSTSVSSSSSS